MTTATGTAQVFLLPDLGEGLTEAEVVRWLVAVGDEIVVDQAICEVETAKSLVEVPSPYAGRVAVLHGAEGATVDVGTPLITVDAATGPTDEAELHREEEKAGSGNVLIGYGTPEASGGRRRRRPRAATTSVTAPVTPPPSGHRRPPRVVSPLVRRIAADAGLDLHSLTPSGFGGIIVRADVERAIAGQTPTHVDPPETFGRVNVR